MGRQRLEYIDLAKGIGILSIVALHVGILPVWLPKLSASWVPLFFILSGMFFKKDERFSVMLIKKINTILVPFTFFYIASYLLYYAFELLTPGLIKTDAKGICDLFTQDGYFNGPIWFLLSLFWDFILLWCILHLSDNKFIHILSVILLFGLGTYLGVTNTFIPLKIAQALTALPFFYIGYILMQESFFSRYSRGYSGALSIGLFTLSCVLSHYFTDSFLEPSINYFAGNICVTLMIIVSFSFATIFIGRMINQISIINYFGRHSLIPLCLHHLVYRPITLAVNALSPPRRVGT